MLRQWDSMPSGRMSPLRVRIEAESEMTAAGSAGSRGNDDKGTSADTRRQRRASIQRIIAPVIAKAAESEAASILTKDKARVAASPSSRRRAENYSNAVPSSATDEERAEMALVILLQGSLERQVDVERRSRLRNGEGSSGNTASSFPTRRGSVVKNVGPPARSLTMGSEVSSPSIRIPRRLRLSTSANAADDEEDVSPFDSPTSCAMSASVSPTRFQVARSRSVAIRSRSSRRSISDQCSPKSVINQRSTVDWEIANADAHTCSPPPNHVLTEEPSPSDRLQLIRSRSRTSFKQAKSPLSQSLSEEGVLDSPADPVLPSTSPPASVAQPKMFRVSKKPTQFVGIKQLRSLKKTFDQKIFKKTGKVRPVMVSDSTVDNALSDMLIFEFDGQMFLTSVKNEEQLKKGMDFPTLLRCMYPECERAVYESMLAQVMPKPKQQRPPTERELMEFEKMWTRFEKDEDGNLDRFLFQEALKYLNISDNYDFDSLFQELCAKTADRSFGLSHITKEKFISWWFSENHTNTERAAIDAANVFKSLSQTVTASTSQSK
mmetsp:Transcript_85/g.167  ORF Transcript_85/g.167 Transcript_85/m.167 type:complete len:549 (+) Transcript_85:39-1685(+)